MCALKRPRNNDQLSSNKQLQDRLLITKYYFFIKKKIKAPWKNDDSRAGTKNVQDEPGVVCHTRKKSNQRLCLKDLGANLNRFLLHNDGTI